MLVRKSILGAVGMLSVAGILSFTGCSSDPNARDNDHAGSERATGSVGLGLTLSDNSEVGEVTYVLTRNGTQVRTGTMAIGADAVASTTLTGLEAGSGYLVALNAVRTAPAGAPPCGGTSAPFAVVAGQTTTVNVGLQCDDTSQEEGNLTVNGTFNVCPRITSTTATPTTAAVGSTVALAATATDRDSDTLSYNWSAADGTFSAATQANTNYTCASAGTKQIGLSVTDGPSRGCTKQLPTPISILCVAAAVDSGTPLVDSGTPVVDSGTPVVDSGSPVVDSGTPVVDSGTPEVDSGSPVVDSGSPAVDSGTPEVDSGSPVVDSGTPEVDSGSPVVDSGTVDSGTPDSGTGARFGSAACDTCLQAQCDPYFDVVPYYADCVDDSCEDVFACFQSNHCATDTTNLTNCYCGDVTFETCQMDTYVAVGPCRELVETGLATTVRREIFERWLDPSTSTGDGIGLFNCAAELCQNECLVNVP